MNRLPGHPWIRNLLVVPLFWLLSACISLVPLSNQSSSETSPPKKTSAGSASTATPGTQPVNGSGSRGSGEASADGLSGSTRAGYIHTVRWQGETLSLIARWYTGSWKNWKALADLNRSINPDRLVIGDKVVIPEALLKNRKPLPRDLVLSLAEKEQGGQTTTSPHPEETEPLDLFGPKE